MESDVHQATVTVGSDLRHARDGVRIEHAIADDSKAAGSLGNEHATVGKEGNGPGLREASGHHTDADLVLLGRIEDPRSRSQWWHWDADRLSVGVADHEQQESSDTSAMFDVHKNIPGRCMGRIKAASIQVQNGLTTYTIITLRGSSLRGVALA